MPPCAWPATHCSSLCLWSIASLIWFRATGRLAALTALFLIVFGVEWIVDPEFMPGAWQPPLQLLGFIGSSLLMYFFLLFPDGRFQPSWSRWPALILLIFGVADLLCIELPPAASLAAFLGILAVLGLAQVYRYRYTRNVLQRQQIKWVALGFTAALAALAGLAAAGFVFSALRRPGLAG